MSAPAFLSPHWHRVEALRPALADHVRIRRQDSRGKPWYLVVDRQGGRSHRLNQGAWEVVGRLSGAHTVDEVWQAAVVDNPVHAPTQGEVIDLLVQLRAADLLRLDLPGDDAAGGARRREAYTRKRRERLNPLAFRVELGDPTRLLERLEPWIAPFLTRSFLALCLVLVLAGALSALQAQAAIAEFVTHNSLNPRHLALALICYPLMKVLHELAHALLIRRYGGTVPQWGFTLFVLMPAPFVDASGSIELPRAQRALVAAAGIVVELACAALAALAWSLLGHGWLRDAAGVVMVIGGASTLLVNGNPLLRFDGYHVLCDLIDVPNLAVRSARWWRNGAFAALGLRMPRLALAAGERPWLFAYAPLALAFRCVLAWQMVRWVGVQSSLLALGIAALLVAPLVALPLLRLAREARDAAGGRQLGVRLRLWGAGCAALCVVTLVPLPRSTTAPGIVWLPEDATLRAGTGGFVARVLVDDGEEVAAGAPVLALADPELEARATALVARLRALDARRELALREDKSALAEVIAERAAARAEWRKLESERAALLVRSPVAGRVVLQRPEDLPGSWIARGDHVAHVVPAATLRVRAAVAHEDAALVRESTREAALLAPGGFAGRRLVAGTPREVRAGADRLPSPALSARNGGSIVTDPLDEAALRTREPCFLFDLPLAAGARLPIGARVAVRFEHPPASLAAQAVQAVRRAVLTGFNPRA
jgi:putative peptide zinc metalloprotease protein